MTNAEARCNKSLRPRKPEGSLGRTAQDVHLDSHTAPELSRRAMARGHRLNASIVLAAVHGLSGLFRAVSAVEPSLSRPLPTLSPSLIGHLASVDVKQHESNVKQR